ncbi:uncharacterized protein PSFLO_01035 [Pseudozyma flocculosa]|nr:uncharacterized protein PSFLO_01035 [Pseudozyma flocculosa]
MPDGPPPCDNVSDLPTWYDPFKDGPLCVVSGAEVKSTERSTASTASTASTLSPPLSLHAFGGAEAWCARRDAPDSPALSSTPSTPALDSSSSQSSIYSPSISSSATSSPDSLHAFVRTPFPAYHLDAASAAAEYRNATAEIATNESGPDAYAGPLFCSNAPLPQTLPVPAFSKRPRWTSPLPAGDRL